ncbi:MAG: UDP-N-acetylenolpyruvoylglucosamine reductase [Parcubacteria group bacterium GW2011_GWA1_47_8]|nr:hypothetical protein [uncultured bacterium]KKU81465.1 MAG: UDP-N-acetylenolpyruvoylglucosamine reductase [Parcubacteria group bacterium GW2011_GWA1_47_8]
MDTPETLIQEFVPLAPLTTMRTGGQARYFARVTSIANLHRVVLFAKEKSLPLFVLGGGSNVLVSDEGFPGLVLKIEICSIAYEEQGAHVCVVSGAGEAWDDLARDAISRSLWGVENLSLVPGTVGGAVVQNIGAYGAEVSEVVAWVEVFDRETGETKIISRAACAFGYRTSIFKTHPYLIVTRVALLLARQGSPRTNYEDVQKYFNERHISEPTLGDIRSAIVAIRTAKLPPPEFGTAGSFFKNPVVGKEIFDELVKKFPEIKSYPGGDDGAVKLSAAWILDHVGGWKGIRQGNVGVYGNQALVLVNYGGARTNEILALADAMKKDTEEKTGVHLEEEVVTMSVAMPSK